MPWESHGGGYRKASDDDDGRGKGFVRNVPQYEALRDKGMSKERAAAITNAHKKKRGPKVVMHKAKLPACGVHNCSHLKAITHTPLGIEQEHAVTRAFRAGHSRDEIKSARSAAHGNTTELPPWRPGRLKPADRPHYDAELRARKQQRRVIGKAVDDDGGASTILVKAYQPGTITQHQEQAKIHRRKARSGASVAARGAGVAAGSALLLPIAHSAHPVAGKAAVAGIAGGLAATAGGGGYAAYHSHLGNKQAEHAQLARRQRNAERDNGASTILAKRAPVRLRKAVERRDAAAAFLGGGAATQGASAVQQHRRANAQRAESSRLHEEAQDQLRVAENRLQRHTMTGKGSLPRRTVDLHSTGKILYTGRAQEHRAAATARNAITADRKAKGRAGMALGLAGAAAAVERGRTRTPRYSSVGYR